MSSGAGPLTLVGPHQGLAKGRKRSGGDGAAGGHGTAWGGSGAPGVAVSAPVKPPADGIPRRIKVARRLGLLPPAGGTDA